MPENIPAQEAQAITLREHLEGRVSAMMAALQDAARTSEERAMERLDGMRREIDLIQRAAQAAVDKAEEAQQLRNEAMNEWRQTVTALVARNVEQRQLETLESSLIDKLDSLEKTLLATAQADREKAETFYQANGKRLSILEEWKSNMQGRMWSIPLLVGVVVFVVTQLMRVLFPAGK